MNGQLSKREVERLTAALDDRLDADAHQRATRLRDAAAHALAVLVGHNEPWPTLVETAARIGSWPPARVRALLGAPADIDETIDALYDLITELNETRRL